MAVLDPKLYSIVWIAPLEIEAQAALHLLDNKHIGKFAMGRGDDYIFQAGDMCGHNVVIATLPAGQEYGTGSAAALASQVKKFFPNLWFGLLVGVAAGLPNLERIPPLDIRLGDVLVGLPTNDGAGLVAYDLGKETKDGLQLLRFGQILATTETVIRSAIGSIKLFENEAETLLPYYKRINNSNDKFRDPGQENDILYNIAEDGTETVARRERRSPTKRTRVWYGSIGSGEKLMKNARKRNELRDKYNVIGLEMEASGIMNRIPVGVVRGVYNYGDEHKNKEWQPYAAAMAAAYARAILAEILPQSIERRKSISSFNHYPTSNSVDIHTAKRLKKSPPTIQWPENIATLKYWHWIHLHRKYYVTIDEVFLSDEDKSAESWMGGSYMFHYPPNTRLTSVILTIDWLGAGASVDRLKQSGVWNPAIEWTIRAPQSLFYPGVHFGKITLSGLSDISFLHQERRVGIRWDSPIFSPFVATDGRMSSEGELEEHLPILDFKPILCSLAHILAFGPFKDSSTYIFDSFSYHSEMGETVSAYFKACISDPDRFARASSFFARAFNQAIPDENDFVGKGLPEQCRQASIVAITELLDFYAGHNNSQRVQEEWNYRDAFQEVNTQRAWAIEERKWADKLIRAYSLSFLTYSRNKYGNTFFSDGAIVYPDEPALLEGKEVNTSLKEGGNLPNASTNHSVTSESETSESPMSASSPNGQSRNFF